MSLLERLQSKKNSLKPVNVNVMLENGMEVVERRNSEGVFVRVEEEHPEVDDEQAGTSSSPQISNRRRKKIEYKRRLGFVVDEKPDLNMARINEYLFLGSQDVAAEFQLLKGASISHIINCATGVNNSFPKHFKYLNLEILDLPDSKLQNYLEKVNKFISDAVHENGKIFVHCNAGISRAPSIVIMHLMSKQISFKEAYDLVKKSRPEAKPNPGFLQQLEQLNF